jgi:hypothetical protein
MWVSDHRIAGARCNHVVRGHQDMAAVPMVSSHAAVTFPYASKKLHSFTHHGTPRRVLPHADTSQPVDIDSH